MASGNMNNFIYRNTAEGNFIWLQRKLYPNKQSALYKATPSDTGRKIMLSNWQASTVPLFDQPVDQSMKYNLKPVLFTDHPNAQKHMGEMVKACLSDNIDFSSWDWNNRVFLKDKMCKLVQHKYVVEPQQLKDFLHEFDFDGCREDIENSRRSAPSGSTQDSRNNGTIMTDAGQQLLTGVTEAIAAAAKTFKQVLQHLQNLVL